MSVRTCVLLAYQLMFELDIKERYLSPRWTSLEAGIQPQANCGKTAPPTHHCSLTYFEVLLCSVWKSSLSATPALGQHDILSDFSAILSHRTASLDI